MMITKAYTLYILEYNNSAVEGEKNMIFQNILNASEQREKIKANQSTPFFCFIELISKGPVTIVTPGGLLITKFVKTL